MAKRFRPRFTFWLDLHKADEAAVAEVIVKLKRERAFAGAVRDGLRLIYDLRAGRAEVLFELFPWVRESLQPAAAGQGDVQLQAQIARLEALMLSQGNAPVQPAEQGRLQKASLVEVTRHTEKSSAKTVAKNFVDSMRNFSLFD